VKTITVAIAACVMAGNVAAAPAGMTKPGNVPLVQNTHGHGGGGWGPGPGVIVDVPWEAIGNANPPAPIATTPDRCREARHACFDQWGTDGARYGRCMRESGC